MTTVNRPLWRWWLFCAALEADQRCGVKWAGRLWAWCILPPWLGVEGFPAEGATGKEPF